ncbi:MAG: DUF817 domain-containing protein [Cytophagia bacterium]|nr:DUF817 domain-containing protein [Cytophagia bacterium]NBW34681.1 DUF817 domain-containing protein [Cytophagia bacterium]
MRYSKELLSFGMKQVLSCIFPAFIFCMLIISNLIHLPFLYRYDFLLIACIVMQAIMYFSKVETGAEVLVITLFHLLGLFMEIFKVAMHSWSYPEFAYSKIFDVPLYSGFMYASVGSYVCQAWRWHKLKLENWPGFLPAAFISIGIYLNFFTHHYAYDFRWVLTLLLLVIFWKTKVIFTTNNAERKMPLVLSFLLIGFFIWVAENMATYLGAWKYASQHEGWKMVSLGKISSWFLLVVLSIVIVIQLKFFRKQNQKTIPSTLHNDSFQ